MSDTTQVTTFQDMYTDLLQRLRQDTSATATLNQAKRYINTGLYDMHIGFGERFPWAERRGVLVTHPPYSTGTVAINQGSTTLTGTSTAWTTSNAFGQDNARRGGKLRIEGSREVYEVASDPGATSITLDTQYLGEDIASDGSYSYFEDEYDLSSDFLRPISWSRFTDGPDPIRLIPRDEFRRRFPDPLTGIPRHATIVDRPPIGDTTPRRRVRLYRVPDKAYQLRYSYVTSQLVIDSSGTAQEQLSGDTDEPIVPRRYRHAIVLWGLYHWYRDKKDDARSLEAKAEYTDLVSRITGDNEIGSPKPKITPRTAPYRLRSRRPWAAGTARFDVDGRWDRLEDL